jgi:integrase
MQFDARKAKLLQPGEHITLDGFPGLRLEVTKSKRSWIYRYKSKVSGTMKQTKIGEWPQMSHAAAISAWEKLRAAREDGADPAIAKREARQYVAPVAGVYTVRRLCADYLAGHVERHRKQKGADIVKRIFASMIDSIAEKPAESITRRHAFDLLEKHSGTPVLSAKLRSELGAAWDYALDAGRIPETSPNWWRLVMRGRLRTKGRKVQGKHVVTKRVLSDVELGELIRWLPNLGRTLDDALTLYLWTGTRGAEIVGMESSEITKEADGHWWTVPKAKTKNAGRQNATDLRVPLVGRAELVVLRRLAQAKDGFLFPARNGGHSEQKSIQQGVYYHQPYCKVQEEHKRPRLTVTHWAPHDLRRTTRTKLAALGCPHEIGEAIIGHVLPGVAGIYNRHAYDTERREWLTLLATKLDEIATLPPA